MISHVVILVDHLFSNGQSSADGRGILSFRCCGKKLVNVIYGWDYGCKIGCSMQEKQCCVLVYLQVSKKE